MSRTYEQKETDGCAVVLVRNIEGADGVDEDIRASDHGSCTEFVASIQHEMSFITTVATQTIPPSAADQLAGSFRRVWLLTKTSPDMFLRRGRLVV